MNYIVLRESTCLGREQFGPFQTREQAEQFVRDQVRMGYDDLRYPTEILTLTRPGEQTENL